MGIVQKKSSAFWIGLGLFAFMALGARSTLAVQFSPVRLSINGDPGQTIEASFKIHNDSDAQYEIEPNAQDFVALGDDETGIPSFKTPPNYLHGIKTWVDFPETSHFIKPRESYVLSFKIHIPKTAPAGGYYGGIFLKKNKIFENNTGTSTVGVNALTGPLVLVRVNGNVIEKGNLTEFSVNKKIQSSLPVDFTTRFKNEGTIHLQPFGKITMYNMFGMKAGEAEFNPNLETAMADSTRRYGTTWQKAEVDAKASELMKEIKNFGFGRYRADLLMSYGSGNIPVNASATFWVIPWMLILIALGILTVIVVIIKLYNRSVIKGYEKKMRKG